MLQLLPFSLGPEQQEVVRVGVSVAAQCLHVETSNNDSGARHTIFSVPLTLHSLSIRITHLSHSYISLLILLIILALISY